MPSVILVILLMSGGVNTETHLVPFNTLEECQSVEKTEVDHAGDGVVSKCYYSADVFERKGDKVF